MNEIDHACTEPISRSDQNRYNIASFPKVFQKQRDAFEKEKAAKLAAKLKSGKKIVTRRITVGKQGLAAALAKAAGANDG